MTAMTMTENPPVATVGTGAWRLNVLGPVELCYDGAPVQVSGPTRTVLALLARAPGEEISTASIVAGLWGSEPPEDSESEVASHVSRLRKALTVVAPNVDPTSVVVTMPAGYILAIQPSNADILAFERLAADGRRAISVGQPKLALARLDAALALWRGNAYEDFGEHAFARAEATRLDELRLAAVESRVDAQLALAAPIAPPQLVTELQTLLAEHWHRERLWGQLMTVLFRLGRRADALAACRRAQETLAEGLRVQAGPELRAIERAVIDSDSSLYGAVAEPGSLPAALNITVPACVGRVEEAAWLGAALDLAATRRAQARLVVGSPGIGKTRLMAEVAQQAAARGAVVKHWRADAAGLDVRVADSDRLTVVVVEDLDQAVHEDVERVATFVQAAISRPVVTLVTCRDPVRVGDLQGLPKLVLSGLDDAAVAEIVRGYAPAVADGTAVAAMVNAGGVPARVHRAASEWAFARAGRRIDRAVADAAEPRRALNTLREEVVAGALELAHVRAKARLLRPAVRAAGCPYPGLAGFGPGDTEIFHGREHLVADVLARLMDAPLLALVGDPGTGKSSLIRAGLLPAVTAGVLPDSAQWRQIVVTPSAADSLAALLVPPPARSPEEATALAVQGATVGLAFVPTQRGPESTMDAIGGLADEVVADFVPAELATEAEPPAVAPVAVVEEVPVVPAVDAAPAPTLLVVDRFEEVFTLLDGERRAEFLDALVGATRTGRVVLSVRSEFYPRCAEHPQLAGLVIANTVLMPPMSEDELRRAILAPAAATGVTVEPGLVDRLIAEVEDGHGGLAQLATTLRMMWHRRSSSGVLALAEYQRGAGLADAVEAYGEQAFARLTTPAARDAGRAMLTALASYTGTGVAIRRRGNLTELLAGVGPAGLSALEELADGGLITISSDVDSAELVHDTVVSHWPRLRDWLTEETAEDGLREHLVRAAAVWAENGRPAALLYRGARLVTVLDWAERHGSRLSTVEREFLAAGNRVVVATEIRRRKRSLLLWKWLTAMVLVAILAIAVAAVAVTMQLRASASAERADAARVAAAAEAEPELRLSLLLAVAAARLDPGTSGTITSVLGRIPDVIATIGAGVTSLALSPDGQTLAAGTHDGPVLVLRSDGLRTGSWSIAARLDYPSHGPVNGLVFTADGRRLVSWGGSRTGQDGASIVVWDVANRKPNGAAFGQVWPEAGGGLLADRSTLVLAQHSREGEAGLTAVAWSVESRTPSTAYQLPVSTVDSVLVSADGRLVVFGTSNGAVIFEPATQAVRTLPGVRFPLAVSPDGRTLLAGDGNDVRAWSLDTFAATGTATGHRWQVLAAAWAPGGGSFATAGADGAVIVWDARTMHPVRTLVGHHLPVRSVQFSGDGNTLYTAGDDGALVAWDLTGQRGVAAALTAGSKAPDVLACAIAGRELSPEEWQRYLPDRTVRPVCSA